MRRSVLALAIVAALSAIACSPSALPSSGVSTTQLPPESQGAVVSPTASQSPELAPSDAAPSEAPSPTASPSPTPKPTAQAAPVCTSTSLTAAVTGWQGAMGSQIATVKVTNASSAACVLKGTPRLQLVDAAGHILIDSKAMGAPGLPHVSPGDKAWTLAKGGWVTTMVKVSDYCGSASPVMPTTIALVLPSGGGRILAAADPNGSAPPCMGDPGDPGSIQMNGWAH